ncbi:MAG: FeoA family protein [Anaerolineae bacterium]
MKPEAKNEGCTTISQLPPGAWGIVRTLTGGRQFTGRLASLGFTAGAAVEVRQNYGFGPVLIWLRGTLVALGRVEASKVFVQSGG